MMGKFNYDSEVVQQNMKEVLDMGTLSIYNESREWYPKAHERAREYANKYLMHLEVTSGLIAVFSPQKAWHHNLILVEKFLLNYKDNTDFKGHTKTQIKKAVAIADAGGLDIMTNVIYWTLGGLKTQNFFHNILNPSNGNYCTIDEHMRFLMTGDSETKKITRKQYEFLKGELIIFAKKNGRIPSQQQAELWLLWKANKWNK